MIVLTLEAVAHVLTTQYVLTAQYDFCDFPSFKIQYKFNFYFPITPKIYTTPSFTQFETIHFQILTGSFLPINYTKVTKK